MTDRAADRSNNAAATIRPAECGDIPAITLIYGHYVRETAVTFETETPDEIQIEQRWRLLADKGYPYLIAELDGSVCGFAFAAPYKPRAAYADTIEESIYIADDARGKGIGTRLMVALIAASEKSGYRQMIAGIADDSNAASLALHRKLGFVVVGRLKKVGRKSGRLIDIVLMQRALEAGE